jgi:hypothetical protein
MAVITGGNIIRNTTQIAGSKARLLPSEGAPVAGTTYAGQLTVGDLVVDVATRNVYEYTEPLTGTTPTPTPTFTRIDTV